MAFCEDDDVFNEDWTRLFFRIVFTEEDGIRLVPFEFDNTGVFAVFVDIRDVETANTVATMELPLELDFLTSFKCQAPIIENRLIEFYGEEKSFKIMTDIQNYLAANFASEV